MFGGMMSGSKDALQMYVKDPEKRVVSLEFQDAQGNTHCHADHRMSFRWD